MAPSAANGASDTAGLVTSLSRTLARGDEILSQVYETLAALERFTAPPTVPGPTPPIARKQPR